MMTTIQTIASALENWAPASTAESYDNVGLLLGDPSKVITRGLIALDLTPAVVAEAIELKAELIVTHHPPIFKPIRAVTTTDFVGSMLLQLAEQGIAVYASHTNLDSARGGVSFELAERLGLRSNRFLSPASGSVQKLVTYVPVENVDEVRTALAAAGAGRIGAYEHCSFSSSGTGTFRGGKGTNPSIGDAGNLETVDEIRLEMEVERSRVSRVINTLKQAHPYEEVAFDVFDSVKPSTQTGLGVIGSLPKPEGLFDFLERVRIALNCESLRFTGSSDEQIQTVAVCGGSGGSLIGDAIRAGADAFVTADLTYHRFFEVLNPNGLTRMALVDAGHYETEAFAEELLASRLSRIAPDVRWEATGYKTSPIGYYP